MPDWWVRACRTGDAAPTGGQLEVICKRRVEFDQTVLDQQQHRLGGEEFGHRGDLEGGVGCNGQVVLEASDAETGEEEEVITPYQSGGEAGDPGSFQESQAGAPRGRVEIAHAPQPVVERSATPVPVASEAATARPRATEARLLAPVADGEVPSRMSSRKVRIWQGRSKVCAPFKLSP